MNILFWGVPAYYHTAYGIQTWQFCKRLQSLGHKVTISSFVNTYQQPRMFFDGLDILPAGTKPFGQEAVVTWARALDADCVISLGDLHVLDKDIGEKLPCPWYPMTTVDSEPLSAQVAKRLEHADRPIAYSHYGERLMQEAGFTPTYIPLGVDTKLFRPDAALRDKGRALIGVNPDAFLVGMVSINHGGRKAFSENIQGFAQFHARHPESVLYIHANWLPNDRGLNLKKLGEACGLVFGKDIIFPSPAMYTYGIPYDAMPTLFNAFDAFLCCSHGEGFGVPIIEAQACGVPAVTTNFSAMKETNARGLRVGYRLDWTELDNWEALPHIDGITDALSEVYGEHRYSRSDLVDFAAQYDFDRVMDEHFVPFLDSL